MTVPLTFLLPFKVVPSYAVDPYHEFSQPLSKVIARLWDAFKIWILGFCLGGWCTVANRNWHHSDCSSILLADRRTSDGHAQYRGAPIREYVHLWSADPQQKKFGGELELRLYIVWISRSVNLCPQKEWSLSSGPNLMPIFVISANTGFQENK